MADLRLGLEIRGADLASPEVARLQRALQGLDAATNQTANAAGRAAQAQNQHARAFGVSGESALRFVGALTGVNIGLSLAAEAGAKLRGAMNADVFLESSRLARATAASYGAAATQFTRFASELAATTGFTKNSILEAALSARTLSENYQLTVAQTQRLIAVSADLAQIRGIGVAQAFERVQSAIRGEAEASEFLGLTLNDTFIKNLAANGAYRQTFETLNDTQKAQIRYVELLRQTATFSGLAAQGATGLEGAQRRAEQATLDFNEALGQALAPALTRLTVGFTNATRAAAEYIRTVSEGTAEERRARQAQATGETISTQLERVGLATTQFGFVVDKASAQMLNAEQVADRLKITWNDLLSVGQSDAPSVAFRFQGTPEALELVRQKVEALVGSSRDLKIPADNLKALADQLSLMGTAVSQLGAVEKALTRGGGPLGIQELDVQRIAQVRAETALAAIEARRYAAERAQLLVYERDLRSLPPGVKPEESEALRVRRASRDELEKLQVEQIRADQAAAQAQRDAEIAGRSDLDRGDQSLRLQEQQLGFLSREADLHDRINNLAQDRIRILDDQRVAQARITQVQAAGQVDDLNREREILLLRARLDPSTRGAAGERLRSIARTELPQAQLAALEAEGPVSQAQRTQQLNQLRNTVRTTGLDLELNQLQQQHRDIDIKVRKLDEEGRAQTILAGIVTNRFEREKRAAEDAKWAVDRYTDSLTILLGGPNRPVPPEVGRSAEGIQFPEIADPFLRTPTRPSATAGGVMVSVTVDASGNILTSGVTGADQRDYRAAGVAGGQAFARAFNEALATYDTPPTRPMLGGNTQAITP